MNYLKMKRSDRKDYGYLGPSLNIRLRSRVCSLTESPPLIIAISSPHRAGAIHPHRNMRPWFNLEITALANQPEPLRVEQNHSFDCLVYIILICGVSRKEPRAAGRASDLQHDDDEENMNALIWLGIGFCISQSAMFSGLNLAFFSIGKLRLEIESKRNNKHAFKIVKLREDSNFLLTTILWGNVGINVLLTLLSKSVMAGVAAFLFSTFIITFLGEIIPQAYFSRHALRTASLLSPIVRFYQFLFYPVAKPTALVLDKWLGPESIRYFREKDLRELLKIHLDSSTTDIAEMEGRGALNFLDMDDLSTGEEGEPIYPDSIVEMDFINNHPSFPIIEPSCEDPFLKRIHQARKKWVILTDKTGTPRLALDSDAFLRSALFEKASFIPQDFCHRPVIILDCESPLGDAILQLKMKPESQNDDVIDKDIILIWGDQKRIITGSDILGRLLKGTTP